MQVYIIVAFLWISAWVQGIRYDKKEREKNEIVEMVQSHLALPSLFFGGGNRLEQIRALRNYLHSHYPGAEIRLIGEDDVFDPTGWELVPITWEDLKIYIKRPEVWDERKFSSA